MAHNLYKILVTIIETKGGIWTLAARKRTGNYHSRGAGLEFWEVRENF